MFTFFVDLNIKSHFLFNTPRIFNHNKSTKPYIFYVTNMANFRILWICFKQNKKTKEKVPTFCQPTKPLRENSFI